MMKRSLILLMVLGLVAGTVATAEAAKKTKRPIRVERTVEGNYGAFPAPVTGCNSVWDKFYCLAVQTRTTESFFTAKVTDVHGKPVFVQVEAGGSPLGTFCGETPRPIRFPGGSELRFYVGLP